MCSECGVPMSESESDGCGDEPVLFASFDGVVESNSFVVDAGVFPFTVDSVSCGDVPIELLVFVSPVCDFTSAAVATSNGTCGGNSAVVRL